MAALLTSILDNTDKVAEYIAECRNCDIKLLPPDVNRSHDGFTVEEGGIRFGLVAIKNIGRGFIQSVVRQRELGGPFTSLQDFCRRMGDTKDMNKRAVENLIRAGAFDSMGAHRSQMVQVYEKIMDAIAASQRANVEGQLDFFGMAGGGQRADDVALPDIPEFSATERMFMEKETTGLYLSGHPMSDYRGAARAAGAVSIHSILEDAEQQGGRFSDGQLLTIAGVITVSRTRTTKNNTLMAYVTVEDELASMELLCFSRVIDRCGAYMQVNLPVLVKGRLSLRDDKPPQLMCDYIEPLKKGEGAGDASEASQAAPAGGPETTVYLRIPSVDSREYRQLERVLGMFEGEDTLKLRIADTGRLLGAKCLAHPAFLEECRLWLGEENVVVRKNAVK